MSGMLLNWAGPDLVVPSSAPADLAVAPNFERFDGLEIPETNPSTLDPESAVYAFGYPYGHTPRPGLASTPVGEQTYTRGAIPGVVGTVGGQPLPVAAMLQGARPEGQTQDVNEYNTQRRLGVGQAYQGVAQTVQLGMITNNPPEPAGMEAILGGWG